jgi:hypothetical protein
MVICDELIYIQLQKTGCTHIASLLLQIFGAEIVGKHNAATQEQIASPRLFLSSIRDPWDWYVSLWSYGAGGRGALMERLTRRNPIARMRAAIGARSAVRSMRSRLLEVRDELTRDVHVWRKAYDRVDNVAAFRSWMRLMHDPRNALSLGEGYADTLLAERFGFMTHRYLVLCCQRLQELTVPGATGSYEDLRRFDQRNCYIQYFVRQERLEQSLCDALEQIRPLTTAERDIIYGAKKTNKSERTLTLRDYYDRETVELVHQRDRLIVEKFGYQPPQV